MHHSADGVEELIHDNIASGLPFIPISLVRTAAFLQEGTHLRAPSGLLNGRAVLDTESIHVPMIC